MIDSQTAFCIKTNPSFIFGASSFRKLPQIVSKYKRVLLVTGSSSFKASEAYSFLQEEFKKAGTTLIEERIHGEPSVSAVDEARERVYSKNIEIVVAIGGGSAIDFGKALSAMLEVEDSVKNYLEGVGEKTPPKRQIPFIAIPTSAGTGSEATKNAVISEVGENGFKKSLRDDSYIADIAIVDPVLTLTCPPSISSACGMDALTQLVESFVSKNSSIYTDSLCEKALYSFSENTLQRVCMDEVSNIDLRSKVAYASYISGVCLANASLGTVHGFASSIGGLYNAPHGVICAKILSPVIKHTATLLEEACDNKTLNKYSLIYKILSGREGNAFALADYIEEMVNSLQIPALGKYGITENEVQKICATTSQKANPAVLSSESLAIILKSVL